MKRFLYPPKRLKWCTTIPLTFPFPGGPTAEFGLAFFFIDNKETCPLKPSHFFLGAPQLVRFRRRRRRRNRRRRNRRSRRSRRRNGCATWNLASPRSRRRTRAPSAWNAGATWPSCAATAPATRARRRCAPATCAASLSPKRSTSTD